MIIQHPATLARFRAMDCEYTHEAGPGDAHHLFSKATGQVDAPWNLVALKHPVHMRHHSGKPPTFEQLLGIVCHREKTDGDSIEAAIWFFRNVGKDPSDSMIANALADLSSDAAVLVRIALASINRL